MRSRLSAYWPASGIRRYRVKLPSRLTLPSPLRRPSALPGRVIGSKALRRRPQSWPGTLRKREPRLRRCVRRRDGCPSWPTTPKAPWWKPSRDWRRCIRVTRRFSTNCTKPPRWAQREQRDMLLPEITEPWSLARSLSYVGYRPLLQPPGQLLSLISKGMPALDLRAVVGARRFLDKSSLLL